MSAEKPVLQQSLFVPLEDEHGRARLHLRHVYRDDRGAPVLMLHGAIENGRIFYSESGRGLAPYLAGAGYDVFVGDLRGRGASTPHITRGARYGQHDSIVTEIPALINELERLKGTQPQIWVGHSWGGVLLLAVLARFPQYLPRVRAIVLFGTKRSIRVWNPEKLMKIDLVWNGVCRLLVRLHGYLPAARYRLGSDDETDLSHLESKLWVRQTECWIDPVDGFDYRAALRKLALPPILSLAGAADRTLGNPVDVQRFLEEAGATRSEFLVVGRKTGYRHDYGHVDLMTHEDAPVDHFQRVLDWLRLRHN